MAVILVVDDDAHIRELVNHYLQREGFKTLEAEDGLKAEAIIDDEKIDLVVLDIMMPHTDGFELCHRIRKSRSVPILMLTAKGQTMDKVKGLRLGADDYMVKPFEPAEFIARVYALLRRYQIATDQVISVGRLLLDGNSRVTKYGDNSIALPPKEFDLLFKLASYPNRTLSRDQLIEEVWGYDFDGDERTVDVHIKRLRDKFVEDECSFRIVTVRGLGYRLEIVS